MLLLTARVYASGNFVWFVVPISQNTEIIWFLTVHASKEIPTIFLTSSFVGGEAAKPEAADGGAAVSGSEARGRRQGLGQDLDGDGDGAGSGSDLRRRRWRRGNRVNRCGWGAYCNFVQNLRVMFLMSSFKLDCLAWNIANLYISKGVQISTG